VAPVLLRFSGRFSMAGDGLQMTAGSDAFNVPPFTDRSSYRSAFGFAGGSPTRLPLCALRISACQLLRAEGPGPAGYHRVTQARAIPFVPRF